jgi:GPH family glycoside/pentoside/hexuronide:cation symporter
LSLKVKLGFGIGDLGGNLFFTVIAFMMPIFLTDTVGLAAGLAGLALMIGKIWDAVIDPFGGYLSDRTRTRWGRRRPYILFGSFPLFAAMLLMFSAPRTANQTVLLAWATGMYCLLCTAFSAVNIPYSALTPELTRDFHQRTVLAGYRMGFAVIGSLLGAGAAQPIVGLFADPRIGFSAMGGLFGAIMMATALITFFSVREPPAAPAPSAGSLWKSYRAALRNRPFLALTGSWVAHTVGITLLSGSVPYYFKYIYRAEGLTPVALLILLATTMAFIPLWVRLSRQWGKKACSIFGMGVIAVALLLVFGLGARLGLPFFFPVMVLAGLGLSTQYVFPWATVPDAVEYDYAQTGERKEGVYYGLWTFIVQLGQALAGAAIGWILAAFRYVPNAEQSAPAVLGIRLLFGPIPLAAYLLGMLSLAFYPLSRGRYQELLERIRRREEEAS